MPFPGWLTPAASFSVGAVAASVAIVAVHQTSLHTASKSNSVNASATSSDAETETDLHLLPLMPVRIFRPNKNLTIAFDTRTKNPLFVMEKLTSSDGQTKSTEDTSTSRKNKRFHEETSLLPYHRSRNSNYKNSGFDRGHLAPAADFASSSDDEMNDTFALTNISPQVPRFNRSIWLRLEEFVRKVAKKEEEGGGDVHSSSRDATKEDVETYVITGPIWLPNSLVKTGSGADSFQYSYEGIGKPPSLVAVPTHFYKVLIVVEKHNIQQSTATTSASSAGSSGTEYTLKKFAAFVLPNSDAIIGGSKNSVQLANYLVRLTDLEAVTGLEFFPALFGMYTNNMKTNDRIPLQKEIADALTDDVRINASQSERNRGQTNKNSANANALVPLANNDGELSKGRQRKIKQILRDNSPLPFQHVCRKNDDCFKNLRV